MAGSATAFQLAGFGRDVTLLERNTIASEASGQNMGGLGGAGWGNMPNLLSYLTMGSLEIFKQLQIDMGFDMVLSYGTANGVEAARIENVSRGYPP